MKKALILAIGLLMLFSISSFASETRTLVMGDNNMIMVDDANMFMFPGRVNNYPNLAVGEFGLGDEFYNFGVTWQFNDDNPWVLGTFVSYWPQFGPENFFGIDMADFDEAANDEPRRLQMLYGRQLGGQNFGFNLDVVRYGWEAENDSSALVPVNTQAKQSFGQYTFGFGLTEATSGQWDLAVRFMTGGWTNEDADGKKITEPNGFMDFGIAGRYFMVRNPKVTFVPHFQFTMGKRGVDRHDDPALFGINVIDDTLWTEKCSRTMFDFGFGMNYTPGPDMLAVLDFGFMYDATKIEWSGNGYDTDEQGEEKESFFVFPYLKIGFEGEVFSWMDFRAGATSRIWSSKYKVESAFAVDETWNTPFNNTYLGFGFHWGRLYLDTYTDPEIILDGFNFISGTNDAKDMNWQVSAIYELF